MFQASVSDCSILTLCRFYDYHFYAIPRPTCIRRFLDRFISSLLPPPLMSGHCCNTSKLHLLPTSFPDTERRLPGSCPHPPTRQPSLLALRPAPHACVGPRRLHSLAVARHVPCPPAMWPCKRRQDTPPPHYLYPGRLDPISVVKVGGA